MLDELKGKTALVTGASRGIGAAAGVALARGGLPRLVLHYGSHLEGAQKTLAEVRDAGADGEIIQADLGKADGIRGFVAQLRETNLKPDILINNAGSLVARASLAESTEALYDRVMNLNVKSVWFITQAIAPGMAGKGGGVVVNVSSIAGRTGGGPGAAMYSAAKAAVTCMTKGMAKELAPKGIRVNAVSPGTVDNHFHQVFSTAQILQGVVAATPAGRLATNEDLADVILFLCSDASRYLHGQTIEVNGGFYAP